MAAKGVGAVACSAALSLVGCRYAIGYQAALVYGCMGPTRLRLQRVPQTQWKKRVHVLRWRTAASSRTAKLKQREVEPFAFEANIEDHCETPGNALRHIAPLLIVLACHLYAKPTAKDSAAEMQIYDPYYCLGGMKTKLARLGFPKVYNENDDFYQAIQDNSTPPFDVLVTNPPFSTDDHIASALLFALASGKPWFMMLPTHKVFMDDYTEVALAAEKASGCQPFFIVPPKKYNFKTPSPLPPPPKYGHVAARHRSRICSTMWVCHGGAGEASGALTNELLKAAFKIDETVSGFRGGTVASGVAQLPERMFPDRVSDEMRKNALVHGVTLP
mmetsp:Transcript_107414/g.208102  ORF Transcript_107414/g.208102 Transcript_107414/m.208102 type:complete len:331 (-) Transcript_107414:31-1023(-)